MIRSLPPTASSANRQRRLAGTFSTCGSIRAAAARSRLRRALLSPPPTEGASSASITGSGCSSQKRRTAGRTDAMQARLAPWHRQNRHQKTADRSPAAAVRREAPQARAQFRHLRPKALQPLAQRPQKRRQTQRPLHLFDQVHHDASDDKSVTMCSSGKHDAQDVAIRPQSNDGICVAAQAISAEVRDAAAKPVASAVHPDPFATDFAQRRQCPPQSRARVHPLQSQAGRKSAPRITPQAVLGKAFHWITDSCNRLATPSHHIGIDRSFCDTRIRARDRIDHEIAAARSSVDR